MNKFVFACLAFMGIPIIIMLVPFIPDFEWYQLILLFVAGVMYNIVYWAVFWEEFL